MKPAFYLAAAAMIACALALLLWPLLRTGRQLGRPRGIFALALGIAVVLPLAAAGLYLAVGTPVALDASSPAHAPPRSGASMAGEPAAPKPQDIQAWLSMAQAYDRQHRAAEARDAYGQALRIDAGNTPAMIGWVEADMAQHADYAADASDRRMLERAIAREPDNQRALWLFGISQFQQKDYAGASATWKRLRRLLDPGSALEQPVARQIAIADAAANMPAAP